MTMVYANALLALTTVMSIVIALGMHLLVFEDMTDEIRRTNLALAGANEEVKRLAIPDSLTGCYNRRFLDNGPPRIGAPAALRQAPQRSVRRSQSIQRAQRPIRPRHRRPSSARLAGCCNGKYVSPTT